ncbi:mevalonate kinase [Streptomyces roseirectus]|uniref:mevalonate kinase n=1 Tax=Streptomyces roseirectus TaxID=2768066 RepID=A0A7H0IPK5_9ACTN|nr:mevalonate kinase [Streptomyces roseirectus]QNP74721.1 mevalonate kinase [Streptomyces roseirectus]
METTGTARRADEPGAQRRRTGSGRAHGKAILLGEHAVVYGAPALAIPLPGLTVTATATRRPGTDRITFAMGDPPRTASSSRGFRALVAEFARWSGVDGLCADVVIDCAIPQGRGLGSSAACARAAVTALADLLGRRLDARAAFALVQASEKVAHGRASGIDALATGATAPLLFRAGTGRELPQASGGLFVVADSGVSGATRDAVELLRRRFERAPHARDTFVGQVTDLTDAAVRDFTRGRWSDFGARMTANHRLLREAGISTDRIDALVEAALAAGALGAKISGGGLGGCLIALADDPGRAETVANALSAAGAVRTWTVPAGGGTRHAH